MPKTNTSEASEMPGCTKQIIPNATATSPRSSSSHHARDKVSDRRATTLLITRSFYSVLCEPARGTLHREPTYINGHLVPTSICPVHGCSTGEQALAQRSVGAGRNWRSCWNATLHEA